MVHHKKYTKKEKDFYDFVKDQNQTVKNKSNSPKVVDVQRLT